MAKMFSVLVGSWGSLRLVRVKSPNSPASICSGFGCQPDKHGSNGWLYDPQDGITYDVTAELTAPNTISARVYRGVPLFGRTEILNRDPQLSFDGRC